MNGADDLPASVRDALARSDDLDERARLLDQLCAQAEVAGDSAVAAWAAVESARCACGYASYTRAVAWCDRALAGDPPPEAHAAATVVRALAGDGIGHVPDGATIARAAEILAASGMWEDASSAHGYLAHKANARGDLASARREYARAIGCAEAGCARRVGPGYLLALAQMETRLGHPRRATGHLDQALARLAHVHLLFARHVEADCYAALGDACAALGDAEGAASAWQEANVLNERLKRMSAARTVRDKLAALRA
jgi:tetratricopeptide (TPR) repeat protein